MRALSLTSIVGLLSLFSSNALAQTTRIKVGYSSIGVGQSLVWVAKEAGLFKENGLDVQLIFIGSSSIVTQAVIAGDVPIAIMSGSTAISSQLAGADLVIAASTKKDPAQAFLVTAKGIADGFPLSAFTTRPEIAAAYKPGDHLSTFGGNPVSCAAALANIQFIQDEDLPARAAETGEYAMKKLRELEKQNPIIGEVRGLGLMIGAELVRDEKLMPANSEAEAIRDSLLRQGVLVGVGGVYGNVVRFQPPLIITTKQIDHAIAAFASALADVAHAAAV